MPFKTIIIKSYNHMQPYKSHEQQFRNQNDVILSICNRKATAAIFVQGCIDAFLDLRQRDTDFLCNNGQNL